MRGNRVSSDPSGSSISSTFRLDTPGKKRVGPDNTYPTIVSSVHDTFFWPSELQVLHHLFDVATFTAQVNDGMAVGTYGPQIGNRVHLVLRADLRHRLD